MKKHHNIILIIADQLTAYALSPLCEYRLLNSKSCSI